MEPRKRVVGLSIALATLAACGGGGGGGSPIAIGAPPPSEVTFTSFAAILPNQTAVIDGIAVTATGNQTIAPNGDYTINSANFNAVSAATVRLSYDGSATPVLRHIDISTPSSPSVAIDRDTVGQGITCSRSTCIAHNEPTASVIFIDASAAGWNYQSLGAWAMDVTPSTYVTGAYSVGAVTLANALPTTGSAVFNGVALGAYFNTSGTPFLTVAGMRADVDFSLRNIQFSTSSTFLTNTNTGSQSTDNGLNLSGTLSYAQGVNSFSGGLTTANGALNGQGTGRFYGPSAQEVGGVYSLSGAGVSRMIGGFGGKR
jgi:transferrin binding protein